MNIQKTIEDIMAMKQVVLGMDIVNFILTVSTCTIYMWRTYDMCYFQKVPIWRNPVIPVTFNAEGKRIIGDPEFCSIEDGGKGEDWYQIFIIVAHIYFLLEFVLRAMV